MVRKHAYVPPAVARLLKDETLRTAMRVELRRLLPHLPRHDAAGTVRVVVILAERARRTLIRSSDDIRMLRRLLQQDRVPRPAFQQFLADPDMSLLDFFHRNDLFPRSRREEANALTLLAVRNNEFLEYLHSGRWTPLLRGCECFPWRDSSD